MKKNLNRRSNIVFYNYLTIDIIYISQIYATVKFNFVIFLKNCDDFVKKLVFRYAEVNTA